MSKNKKPEKPKGNIHTFFITKRKNEIESEAIDKNAAVKRKRKFTLNVDLSIALCFVTNRTETRTENIWYNISDCPVSAVPSTSKSIDTSTTTTAAATTTTTTTTTVKTSGTTASNSSSSELNINLNIETDGEHEALGIFHCQSNEIRMQIYFSIFIHIFRFIRIFPHINSSN